MADDQMVVFNQDGLPVASMHDLVKRLPIIEPGTDLQHTFPFPGHTYRSGDFTTPIRGIGF